MAVELRPFGQRCKNPLCTYCYQKGNKEFPDPGLDLDEYKERVKDAVERTGEGSFVLFGGDPGEYDEDVLKELVEWGYDEYGKVSMQTGGWWITEEWIDYLSDYNVNMGISIDGPWPLNEKRILENKEKTKEYTERLNNLLPKLQEEIGIGMITTLHDSNLLPTKRYKKFKDWLHWLDGLGISGRLHVLQKSGGEEVDPYIYKGAMIDLAQEMEDFDNVWRPFPDFPRALGYEDGNTTCYMNSCDPYHTQAVEAVDRDGISVCSRNFKEGLRPLKADEYKAEMRNSVLKNTPQDEGGCKNCKWWGACTGGCPGTAEDGDWRNKTMHCDLFKALYSYYEGQYSRKNSEEVEGSQQDKYKTKSEQYKLAKEKGGYHEDQGTIHADAPHGDKGEHKDSNASGQNRESKSVEKQIEAAKKDGGYHEDGNTIHADKPHGDSA